LYLSHLWGIRSDLMSQLGAIMGPVGIAIGIGMAIHGAAMPPTHITRMARVWGTIGSVAAIGHLWMRGYFNHAGVSGRVRLLMPVALVIAWWLPGRFYGEEEVRSLSRMGRCSEE
jgi:hypothetical protein